MNILFIIPLNESYDSIISANRTALRTKLNIHKNIKKLYCVYPSGVLSISAYIKKNNPDINVKILDLNVFINQIAQSKIASFDEYTFENYLNEALLLVGGFVPDIIGISALFCSVYQDLKLMASFFRKHYKKSTVVCGGHLASTLYDRIYEDDLEIDAVAFGEGEIPFLELITAISTGKKEEYLSSSPCWITKEKCRSATGIIPHNKVIEDLDEIPPYDLSILLFPDAYFDSSSFLFMPETHEDHKEMIMFSTRGCPHNCTFCASHQVHGKKVRFYTADRVKNDILYYNEKYKITRFVFYDDHFLMKKSRALEILNFISENNLVAAIINPAFFSIDKDIASAMKRAGVRSVILSIESGNENTFKNIIHKPSNLEKANEAVELLHEKGINVATNVMIGLPGETEESIDIGLKYLLTTNFNWFNCFVVAPLPGSELYKSCKDNGYFTVDDPILLMDFKKCVIRTKDFAPDYIEKKVYEMNLMLNFVNHYDIRSGNYHNALMLFEKVINSVLDTHAFAYYFAAKCCRMLQLDEKYNDYKAKYEEMIAKYPFWRGYAIQFNLKHIN